MKKEELGIWLIIFMGMGLAFFVLTLMIAGSKEHQEVKQLLFSCYKQEGMKCTVTSTPDKPCSYYVLICKSPEGKTIYRSEKYAQRNQP